MANSPGGFHSVPAQGHIISRPDANAPGRRPAEGSLVTRGVGSPGDGGSGIDAIAVDAVHGVRRRGYCEGAEFYIQPHGASMELRTTAKR